MPRRVYKAVPLTEDPGWAKVGDGFYTEVQTLYRATQRARVDEPLVFWKYATQENSVYGGTVQLFEEYRGRRATWRDGVSLVSAVGEYAFIEKQDLINALDYHREREDRESIYQSVWPDLAFGPLPGEDDGLR